MGSLHHGDLSYVALAQARRSRKTGPFLLMGK